MVGFYRSASTVGQGRGAERNEDRTKVLSPAALIARQTVVTRVL